MLNYEYQVSLCKTYVKIKISLEHQVIFKYCFKGFAKIFGFRITLFCIVSEEMTSQIFASRHLSEDLDF